MLTKRGAARGDLHAIALPLQRLVDRRQQRGSMAAYAPQVAVQPACAAAASSSVASARSARTRQRHLRQPPECRRRSRRQSSDSRPWSAHRSSGRWRVASPAGGTCITPGTTPCESRSPLQLGAARQHGAMQAQAHAVLCGVMVQSDCHSAALRGGFEIGIFGAGQHADGPGVVDAVHGRRPTGCGHAEPVAFLVQARTAGGRLSPSRSTRPSKPP